MMAALATALFTHRRIKTTLAKAKALRPFAEHLITYAKKAAQTEQESGKLHYRRLAASRLRDPGAVRALFDEHAKEFLNRAGGYTRIYKLIPRASDAALMALIEIIPAGDEGYKKARRKGKGKSRKGAPAEAATPAAAPAETPAAPEAKA